MTQIGKIAGAPQAQLAPEVTNKTPWVAMASGSGGLAGAIVSNGPRVVKTRAQLQLVKPGLGLRTPVHGLPLYGAVSSVANLWCFTIQHMVKSHLGGAQPSLVCALSAGIGAGMSESFLTNPARRVLVRHAVAAKPQTLRQAAKQLYREEGIAGLWRGTALGAVRNGVGWGTYFATLNVLRRDGSDTSPMRNMRDSSVACAASCLVAMPFDTIVTQMQRQGGGAQSASMLLGLVKSTGVKGLYAGVNARLAQAVPASAVSFLVMGQSLHVIEAIVGGRGGPSGSKGQVACEPVVPTTDADR